MQDLKAATTRWINDRGFCRHRFEWREGFGVFSYTKSQVPEVCAYVERQKAHHQQQNFLAEYHQLLEELEVDFDARYIFKAPE